MLLTERFSSLILTLTLTFALTHSLIHINGLGPIPFLPTKMSQSEMKRERERDGEWEKKRTKLEAKCSITQNQLSKLLPNERATV